MKIRIGHSPDADDAFMFWALTQGKIPSEGFQIEHVVEDIESLNQRALGVGARSGRPEGGGTPPLHVTALSCHAFGFLTDRYQLIPYGASVGENYGPIVIARQPIPSSLRGVSAAIAAGRTTKQSPSVGAIHELPLRPPGLPPRNDMRNHIRGKRIAVPGRYTTAYLVLRLFEEDFEPVFTPFDKIFSAIEEEKADLGLLIHEGQLTYREKGFEKIVDLGEWWFEEYRLPLPLGINAVRKELPEEAKIRFTRLFLKSIEHAMAHRKEALHYALEFGRGIDAGRGDRFVGMYVNDYSLELGVKGMRALELLFQRGYEKNLFPSRPRLEAVKNLPSRRSRITEPA